MLYIIHGDNIIERKKAYDKIGKANLILNKESVFPIEILLSHIDSVNLWDESQNIFISDFISDKVFREAFYDNLEYIKNSDNKFVIDEIDINAATLTKLKAFATAVYNATPSPSHMEMAEAQDSSPFLLCDYITVRDKKKAWIELMRLYDTDIDSEPLHGAIWWKWKMIWPPHSNSNLISKEKDIIKVGQYYSLHEIEKLGHDLIMIPLRAHNGECDFRLELERWILSIS